MVLRSTGRYLRLSRRPLASYAPGPMVLRKPRRKPSIASMQCTGIDDNHVVIDPRPLHRRDRQRGQSIRPCSVSRSGENVQKTRQAQIFYSSENPCHKNC